MGHQKDYSLLRPFDLEAAKRGEKICTMYGNDAVFIGMSKMSLNKVVFESDNQEGVFVYSVNDIKMASIAWVEGRPVYKGDMLYFQSNPKEYSEFIAYIYDGEKLWSDTGWMPEKALTWQKPKTKKKVFVNLYKDPDQDDGVFGYWHDSEDGANAEQMVDQNRLACVEIEIEE